VLRLYFVIFRKGAMSIYISSIFLEFSFVSSASFPTKEHHRVNFLGTRTTVSRFTELATPSHLGTEFSRPSDVTCMIRSKQAVIQMCPFNRHLYVIICTMQEHKKLERNVHYRHYTLPGTGRLSITTYTLKRFYQNFLYPMMPMY